MRGLFTFLLLLFCLASSAQFTDRYWTFGDSAGIDFSNINSPVPAMSMLRSRGTCASICDSSGSLLFYCGSPQVPPWPSGSGGLKYGYVGNRNHELMDNGDKLYGGAWYQEMVIVPDPGNINRFYVFCAGVLNPVNGLYYSIVDLTYNGGLGKVIQKNVQLNGDTLCDGITAIQHGNGRDWWIITKNWSYAPIYRNDIQVTLVTPTGSTLFSKTNIGSLNTNAGFTRLKFNQDGSHLYCVHNEGMIDRFDFDRCTGVISNFYNFVPAGSNYKNYWGFEISPNESKIYTTSIYNTLNQDSSFLFQFDLNATNFLGSVDTLGTFVTPDLAGILQKGPDNKIYLSVTWAGPDTCNDYLYCYGTVNNTNSNISVINYPDSSSTACDFQPFSFYLGGHKAYTGLPNNPNYELGRWVGSPCDTLTVGISETIGYKKILLFTTM
jgi:large repetitive protein